ncbi:MAG: ABC transporter substrate-binding protein [Candidatus Rokuibacteriota bacterium]
MPTVMRFALVPVLAALLVTLAPVAGLAADKVSFRADWLFWAGHLPYVVGKSQGIFEKNGIDLELVQGSGSAASVKLVATGTHQMGLASGTNAIMARAEGLPIKVVGIAYQWDPWGFMWLPEAKISGIKDFKGRRIADTKASVTYPEMLAALKKHGLDAEKDVTVINVQPGGATQAVASGTADIGNIMIFRDNFALERITGKTPQVLPMKDLGINIYGMTVIANEAFLKEKPDVARRVLKSLYECWEMAFKDPGAAVEAFHKLGALADKGKPPAETRRELDGIIPFIKGDVYQARGLGWSDRARWEEAVGILLEQKVISANVDVDALFTNEFLPRR